MYVYIYIFFLKIKQQKLLFFWLLHPADHDHSGTCSNFVDSNNILISEFNNNYVNIVLFESDDAIVKLMERINSM